MRNSIENQIGAMNFNNPFQGIIYFRSDPGGRPSSGGGSRGQGGGYYDQPYRGWTTDPTGGGRPVTPQGPTYPVREDSGIGYRNDGGHRGGPDPGNGRGNRDR